MIMAGRIRQVTVLEDRLRRLGELVTWARLAMIVDGGPLSNTKTTLASEFGSRDTVHRVETGLPVLPVSYAMIEQFFGWIPGSILDYLDHNGSEPQQPEPGDVEATQTIVSKLGDLSASDQAEVDKFVQYLKSRRTDGRDT
jgi:hypothetical protein